MEQEQARLELIAHAERQLVLCRLLAAGRLPPESAAELSGDIDKLQVDGSAGADPTTLTGSLVITREFLDAVADAAPHGTPWHKVPWPETCVCLEEILESLRRSQPVRSETLMTWWKERSRVERLFRYLAPAIWTLFVLISLATGTLAASAISDYKALVFLGSAAVTMLVFMVFADWIWRGALFLFRVPSVAPSVPTTPDEEICLYIEYVLERPKVQPSAIFACWPATDRPLYQEAKALLTSAVEPDRDEFDQAKVRSLMLELGDIRERIRNESAQEHER